MTLRSWRASAHPHLRYEWRVASGSDTSSAKVTRLQNAEEGADVARWAGVVSRERRAEGECGRVDCIGV